MFRVATTVVSVFGLDMPMDSTFADAEEKVKSSLKDVVILEIKCEEKRLFGRMCNKRYSVKAQHTLMIESEANFN